MIEYLLVGKPNTLIINPDDDEDGGSFSKRSASDVGELHAIARRAARNRKKAYGKTILYFGCRNSHMDHIYKEELEKAKMSGALDNFHVAFSRDKEVMEKVSSGDGGWTKDMLTSLTQLVLAVSTGCKLQRLPSLNTTTDCDENFEPFKDFENFEPFKNNTECMHNIYMPAKSRIQLLNYVCRLEIYTFYRRTCKTC